MLTGNRWARRVEDFATKVEVDDVEGFFKKGLLVEAGTKAIFFVNGAYSGILDPGKYEMGGLLQKIKNVFNSKSTTAVLIDAADVELRVPLGGLQTSDPIKLAAECRMVIQLDNPTQFFENVMKGRQNYPLTELRSLSGRRVAQLRAGVRRRASRSRNCPANLAFKQRDRAGVAQHLAKTFGRTGLAFIQVRVFDFRHPRLDALNDTKEEYWLHCPGPGGQARRRRFHHGTGPQAPRPGDRQGPHGTGSLRGPGQGLRAHAQGRRLQRDERGE